MRENISKFKNKLLSLKEDGIVNKDSFIVFIDDGSNDNTQNILEQSIEEYILALILASNRGHQNALLAGIEFVANKCDCSISIDCDLEQDINKIEEFINHFNNGSHIVFGVRINRKSDGFFKKYSALSFYKIMKLFGVKIITNHADYRLLSKKAMLYLKEYNEVNLFLRGIILEIGLKHSIVYFNTKRREFGKSKYNLYKMLSLALNGITSFSIIPLRIITFLGFIICIISGIFGIYAICVSILGFALPGWTSTIVPIYLLSGVQMLSLGIIGEYIGKIYKETKQRPRYFIDKILKYNKDDNKKLK